MFLLQDGPFLSMNAERMGKEYVVTTIGERVTFWYHCGLPAWGISRILKENGEKSILSNFVVYICLLRNAM